VEVGSQAPTISPEGGENPEEQSGDCFCFKFLLLIFYGIDTKIF
jgi:hypothetical protein